MTTNDQAAVELEVNDQCLKILFSGILNIDTVATLWEKCLQLFTTHVRQHLIIDAQRISYCDSAGVSLFLQLKESQLARKGQFELLGLADKYQHLFNLIENLTTKPIQSEKISLPLLSQIGKFTLEILTIMRQNTLYIGELCDELFKSLLSPRRIRWRDVWQTIEIVGPNALPIVLLLGFLMGLIMSFQSAVPLQRFGAVIYIVNIVGISLTRELAPLMVAIILAGRTASSFAAEIGTMKVNQEIDALSTMGLKPLLFLAVPRVIAVMVMTPLLNIFMIVIGLIGCALFMMGIGYSADIFIQQIQSAITIGDLLGGLFKSVIFGLFIASIGCMYGLRTRFGASAVGESTTKAVVSCIIMLVIVDGIFAVLFYLLGI
ncbi:MAG: hypothetical protein A3E87_08290 [Gammaproteobacteria bacterium RIFCSPHIGHO2_12_FULL_35_23]|nr:MAG: hypothetical protein A3E87_08290 [Gammaproteobacteria bacterium RIFCSPHIGHO2_12_FULL_35_23]